MDAPTREVFGNVEPWMRVVFYGLIVASLGVLAWQVRSRAKLWKQGRPGGFEQDWRLWWSRLWTFVVAQKRVRRRSLGGFLHQLLFTGFVALTIGTTLLMIADAGPVRFHHGWYYLIYEFTLDVFGLGFCIGCGLALFRRGFRRPTSLGHSGRDWVLLGVLLALGVTGFLVEALRLRYTQVSPDVARWSVVGHAIDTFLLPSLAPEAARGWHLALWWIHAFLVAGLLAGIPVTRFLHVLTGPITIATRPTRSIGTLAALRLEDVEQAGRVGAAAITDFNRQQLLSLDACMECGRCEEVCPATASGKPLSPKKLVSDLAGAMSDPVAGANLHAAAIQPETLWACTMCQACVQECPVLIGHVDLVSDLRRNLVGEGRITGPPARAMASLGRHSNPYGRPARDRLAWSEGLSVPTVEANPDFEYLLWVGCAGAFDPRAQKVTRSLVQLLQRAGVNFAVLGVQEGCTGDPARRLGDEFLFQQLATTNIETLNARKARKIITSCPHCLNSLRSEYPQFGGNYEVRHHTQFLQDLIASGRLPKPSTQTSSVAFHDPCYLARVEGEIRAPRQVLASATGSAALELRRHGARTSCCGAGGGRAWMEEPATQRVSRTRAAEAQATGARVLATACPFCLTMMGDALAANTSDAQPMEAKDIAEVLWGACQPSPTQAAPGSSKA